MIMPDPNALYEDMEKLNALYEELCWGHDDELVFTHENGRKLKNVSILSTLKVFVFKIIFLILIQHFL